MSTATPPAGSSVIVLGGGEIGLCMAAVFADSGVAVTLVEPDAARAGGIPERIAAQAADMATATLGRRSAADLAAAVAIVPALADAPADPALILEAGPEKLPVKREIFASARAWAGPDVPIATTSSALTISEIVPDPAARRHCLVAHCANPPTIVRVIECVPAPETDPATVDRVAALLAAVGFHPVRLNREIPGFVFNRLQSAMLREAYRLVRWGIVDVDGVDTLVSEGLGPRWALSGPFETVELNTPGGIKAHAARMGPAYRAIGEANGERDADWPDDLVETVDRQRRATLPADRLPDRVDWRRRALARLMATRKTLIEEWAGGAAPKAPAE